MELFFVKHSDNRKSLSYNIPVGDESIAYFTIADVDVKIEEVMDFTVEQVFNLIDKFI